MSSQLKGGGRLNARGRSWKSYKAFEDNSVQVQLRSRPKLNSLAQGKRGMLCDQESHFNLRRKSRSHRSAPRRKWVISQLEKRTVDLC